MNKFQIEIVDTEVQILSGTSKAGKPYEMKLQAAYLHNGGAYPEKFELILHAQRRVKNHSLIIRASIRIKQNHVYLVDVSTMT